MGNAQQEKKKIPVVNKTQLQVACTKARIHLELMRDRKNAEIVKGQRQLVLKLKSQGRNKVEQLLIAERVTNGLKYAQACNQLASYASTLKSQANYVAENVANPQKMQPWLPYIFTLHFAADRMGLSSLNDFRYAIRTLYDPQSALKYCDQDIVLLLSPTPTPQQINVYIVEMAERNNITLEEINIIGHKFTKELNQASEWDPNFLDVKKKLAEEIAKNMQGGRNQGFNGENHPGGSGGNQGFGDKGQSKLVKQQVNPYGGASSMKHGPQYYQPGELESQKTEQPREFPSWEQMMKTTQENNHRLNIYPDVDPKEYKGSEYKPIHNPFTPPQDQDQHNTPTLSQIMRDFDKKN